MIRIALCLWIALLFPLSGLAASDAWHFDRSLLPAELRDAPLDRVSSGGLMLLDRDENIVRAPHRSVEQETVGGGTNSNAAGVALDGRVGPNIRLGDDPPSLLSRRAQAEPHIVRSETDFDFVVATFQEGRFEDGGAQDVGYSTSHDGGLTWSRVLLPSLTQLTGGPYFRATDPVVGIDLPGNVFINTDAARDRTFDHGDIVISRSVDGGATFQAPVVVYAGTNQNYFADKNWMAVNTFAGTPTAGRVLVTFTLFTSFSSNSSPSPLVAYYSDDAGQSWNPSNGIGFITPSASSLQGSQPVYLPNGSVALVYWRFLTNNNGRLEVIKSADGGANFGGPVNIANITQWNEPTIRTGSFLPSAATDRTTGNLYVVIQATFGGSPRVVFMKSTDGGGTWSAPIPISDNPVGSGVFNPAISASADGRTLTAVFYDRRDNPGSTNLVDLYEAQSFDGGATWQPNIRVTSASSNAALAPKTASGYMLGDYLGIAAPENVHVPAIPVFVDTRTGNPDPFVTRIGVAPQFDFTSWQAARLSLAQINNPQSGIHQLNISTRLNVGLADNALIAGFILTGTESKRVIIRGIGPSLAGFGIAGTLQDPTLDLRDSSGAPIAFDDNWRDSQSTDISDTGLAPSDDRESAIVRTLFPGNYTAILRGKGNTSGIGLVEVYDLASGTGSQLGNLSTRGLVQAGDNVMIGGFIVGGGNGPGGTGSEKVVVRALGPSLATAGVVGALDDPVVELHDANGLAIFTNDNWRDTQATELAATGLAPKNDRESALVVTLPPGNFTAIVRGQNDTTGVGLVEVYNVQ